MEDKIINLALPLSEVNKILTYLGSRKYSQVAVLIAKIQSQTLPQVDVKIPVDEKKQCSITAHPWFYLNYNPLLQMMVVDIMLLQMAISFLQSPQSLVLRRRRRFWSGGVELVKKRQTESPGAPPPEEPMFTLFANGTRTMNLSAISCLMHWKCSPPLNHYWIE